MKRLKILPGIILASLLLLYSCSKEEGLNDVSNEQATLSFNALFNDVISKTKNRQSSDAPQCTSGTPAFVDVVLSYDGFYVVGDKDNPERIPLNPNATDPDNDGIVEYFTEESSSLELSPGTYSLEYFTVLDENGSILWIAPIDDGAPGGLDDLMNDALPLEINLGAGVKKYVDVEVICFDDRVVNEYGYLFFDLDTVEVIEFCIFGNYCDETGRHAEFVQYSVNVWKYGDLVFPKGEVLYENLVNPVVVTDYEDYAETAAEPLCISLPDGPGFDEYYIEITMITPGNGNELIRSGLISDADVRALFNGDDEVEYYHFREGNCNLEDSPLLLTDQRDVTGYDWEFTFFNDYGSGKGQVKFYPDGTALYSEPNDPFFNDIHGYWSFFDNYLFYDLLGDGDWSSYFVSGHFDGEKMSGTYTLPSGNRNWEAVRINN